MTQKATQAPPPILPSFREWLDRNGHDIDAIVFDVDGVLVKGRIPVPGADSMIRLLHQRNLPFALLTNDGCHSPQEKADHLAKGGIPVRPEELASCSHGLIELVDRYNWQGKRFFVMGSLGDPCYAQLAGLQTTRDVAELPTCAGVIVGEKDYDWCGQITAVFNLLMQHPDTPLIVPNPDEYFPSKPGQFGIGSGAVGLFLQRLCQKAGNPIQAIFLGKPFEPIFLYNHHRFEMRLGRALPRNRVVMVGDSLASDIPGGNDFGYRTALMLTGITTVDMLRASNIQPDLVFQRL